MVALMAGALIGLQGINTLTAAETAAGWSLLFDGKTTEGWSNFKATSKTIRPGWKAQGGELQVVDPDNAGDLVTNKSYKEFELSIDYKVWPGSNSGIMFHVGAKDDFPWMTGPEVQILDNPAFPDAQKAGWLYELYKSDKDTTRPAGQWNTVTMMVSKKDSWVKMNGELYYSFEYQSDDFVKRVKASKFGTMPNFAQSGEGAFGLQGDHGKVAFRNIKVREIK